MLKQQRVLILDDDPKTQKVTLQAFARLESLEIETIAKAEGVIEHVEKFCPDLVLVNISSPRLEGHEICRQIRANPKINLVKIILVADSESVGDRQKGYAVGADEYVNLSIGSEELSVKAQVFLRLARLEAELVSAAKMSVLGEMAGAVAHEINTPLSTITLAVNQLERILNTDPINRDMIFKMSKMILDTVRRIGVIVHGLKTFSRDDKHEGFSPVTVHELIENTLTLCREKLKNQSVELQTEPIPESLYIYCRKVQISQVLLNLIGNAADAISNLSEKWIRISIKEDKQLLEISITDSGSGIPEDVRNKIFQPFFTTKIVGKGTGLGLSISKGIIEDHRGKIEIDPLCKNTRFVITLPVNPKE